MNKEVDKITISILLDLAESIREEHQKDTPQTLKEKSILQINKDFNTVAATTILPDVISDIAGNTLGETQSGPQKYIVEMPMQYVYTLMKMEKRIYDACLAMIYESSGDIDQEVAEQDATTLSKTIILPLITLIFTFGLNSLILEHTGGDAEEVLRGITERIARRHKKQG